MSFVDHGLRERHRRPGPSPRVKRNLSCTSAQSLSTTNATPASSS
ncbi:putative transposase (plasmid) [Rhodococcus erythropolis PR4]|uniref:Putative transposase n=1 Tax=Rhodococcus erythropolis (strain PR4 / NBRC 100887) TaxID=234621 RepID=Q3L9D0_RHOE4|nr:putative transposase [Rhodococcus erythropolis PR4]